MKRGRKPITDTVPKEKILRAFEVYKSINKTASVLKLSYKTVQKVLGNEGIGVKSLIMKMTKDIGKKYGGFALWLQKDKEKTLLPRSVTAIAKISGCSYDQVRCYLYRRRKALKEKLLKLPDLRTLDLEFKDTLGVPTYSKNFESYNYILDVYTLHVYIKTSLKSGEETEIDIPDLSAFIFKLRNEKPNSHHKSASS